MSYSVRPHRWQPTRLPHPWDSPGKNTGVGCPFLLQCMKVKSESEVTQSCPALSNPWTAAHQAPPSVGFSRQEYWSRVPLPSPSSCHRPLQIQNFLNDRGIFVIHNEPLSTTDNTSVYANEITLDRDPRQLYSGSWPSERPNTELEGWNFQVKALKSGEVRRGWRLSSIKVLEHWDS